MSKKSIQINIQAEELRKKLNIKDGYSPIKGVDYFDGEKGDRGDTPDTLEVAYEASKLAQVELEKQIPTITQIVDQLPLQPEKYRDGLELLQDDERLDKKAIRGLDDYEEISALAREPRKVINKNYVSGGTALQNLQQVTDNGATTTVKSTFSGGLISGLGTAALPSYSFLGDTDTGMWSSGANNISFSTNGIYRGGFLSAGKFEIDRNGINFLYVTKPTAPTMALAGVAGLVPVGTHWYYITYITADGETEMTRSASSITVASAANAQVTVTIPVSSDPRVTGRKIYRSTSNTVGGILATVANNTATTYTDNIATTNANVPYRQVTVGNTTAGNIFAGGTKIIEIESNGAVRLANSLNSLRMAKTTMGFPQLAIFNTVDEENASEFGGMVWTSNILEMGTFGRGAGLARKARFKSSNASVSLNFDLERGGTDWASIIDSGTSIGGVSFVRYNPTNWTSSAGENRILTLGTVALSNTGTGGYSLFNIDATGGTGGSGSKFFTRYTLGGATIHSINYLGNGYFAGNLGIGITSPTALIHIKAGTATVSTAPLKFTSGTLLTTPEAGAIEFLTDKFYATITTGAAREEITLNDIALTSGRVPFVTTNGRLTDDADMTFATDTLTVAKVVGSTSLKSVLLESTGTVRLKGFTVATLPVGVVGDTAYCSDLLAPTFFTVAVGGGAVVGPVFYNGTVWIVA